MSRASAPVSTAVTLTVALVVGAAVAGTLVGLPAGRAPTAVALSLSVSGDRVALTHRGGASIDVAAVDLRVVVDGTPLAHQPPVPFFAARGFASGPTGPFNPAGDTEWNPRETATFRIAETNRPRIVPGDRVAVVVTVDGRRVARLTATATPPSARGPPPGRSRTGARPSSAAAHGAAVGAVAVSDVSGVGDVGTVSRRRRGRAS